MAGGPGGRGLVHRYYLFRLTNAAGFYLPVAVYYLQDRGFGLGFIGLAYAVYGFGTLVAEIPTGYVGDWLGRRRSLAVGATLRVVVLGAYPFVATAGGFLALHVVWATGRSFRSGTQDAWLYELLAARFDEGEFARVDGRGSTVVLVTSAVGAVAGALLYGVDPALPFVVNAGLAALGIPLLATFPRVPRGASGSADRDDGLGVREALVVLRLQVRRPAVRWLVAYLALFHAVFVVTRVYEQPALGAVGVPVLGMGVLYAAFKLVSAGAAASVGWLDDALGTRGVLAALVPVYGVVYVGLLVAPVLVVPVLFVNRGLKTVTRPVRNQYLNDRLDDVGRATVLSGASMVLAFVGAVARLAVGSVAGSLGAVGAVAGTGLVLAVAAGVLWLGVDPVRERTRGRTVEAGRAAPTD